MALPSIDWPSQTSSPEPPSLGSTPPHIFHSGRSEKGWKQDRQKTSLSVHGLEVQIEGVSLHDVTGSTHEHGESPTSSAGDLWAAGTKAATPKAVEVD